MKQVIVTNQQVNTIGWDKLVQCGTKICVTRPEKSLHFWFVNTELNLHF